MLFQPGQEELKSYSHVLVFGRGDYCVGKQFCEPSNTFLPYLIRFKIILNPFNHYQQSKRPQTL